jgi:hypothetical protein
MATKSGELREMLVSSIEDVRSGKMDAGQAAAVAKLAQAISQSISVELQVIEAGKAARDIGSQRLGEEKPLLPGEATNA